jgi:vacuolar-type H+-ATPase subunit H
MATPSQGTKVIKNNKSQAPTSSNKETIRAEVPLIIGLPPQDEMSSNMILNSMPILEIIPSIPNFQQGLTLFTLKDAKEQYKAELKKVGYSINFPIQIAFIADNFPSLSVNNEWGESFLQKSTDVASQGASEIAFMTGTRTASEGVSKIAGALAGSQGEIAKTLGAGILGAKQSATDFIGKLGTQLGNKGVAERVTTLIDEVMAGNRIDFPHVWKGSSFVPTFSITVRLHNPVPANDKMHENYLLAPLAALLTLGTPIQMAKEDNVYGFPFLCNIKCKGLFIMNPAAISGISVQLGMENMIAYNQRPTMIDVRIEFQSLYTSLITGKSSDRPSIGQYLTVLREKGTVRAESPDVQFSSETNSIITNSTDTTPTTPSNTPTTIPTETSSASRINNSDMSTFTTLQQEQPVSLGSVISNVHQTIANIRSTVTGVVAEVQSNINEIKGTVQGAIAEAKGIINEVTAIPGELEKTALGVAKEAENTAKGIVNEATSTANSVVSSAKAITKVQNYIPRF